MTATLRVREPIVLYIRVFCFQLLTELLWYKLFIKAVVHAVGTNCCCLLVHLSAAVGGKISSILGHFHAAAMAGFAYLHTLSTPSAKAVWSLCYAIRFYCCNQMSVCCKHVFVITALLTTGIPPL